MAGRSTASPPLTSWRRDFRQLWTAETVSSFGSQITTVALPLTAAGLLHASAGEMGILAAGSTLPNLLFSFYFGALVDRVFRRWALLVWADLLRMVLIGLIPVAWAAGFLSIGLLIVIAFVTGAASLSFGITWSAYLPSVVPASNLVEANSKLQASMTVADLGGVSLAGALVQLFGAPNAMTIDAASFAVSALFLARMRYRAGQKPAPRAGKRNMWREVGEGLRYCINEPRLRAIAGAAANLNLFSSIALALGILFLNRTLRIPPYLISLIFAAWGVGAVGGAVLAPMLGRRFTEGRTIIAASAVFSIALFAYPPVHGPVWFASTTLMIVNVAFGFAVFVFDVHTAALRQIISPDELQGRTASAMAFVTQGVKPLGALIGGVLGETIGIRGALWIAAAGTITTVLWTYRSPLRLRKGAEVAVPEPDPVT
jgi:MFS family permease